MPRTNTFPPTPAPSTDITGKENGYFSQTDPAFSLPPSAVASRVGSSGDVTMDAAYNSRMPFSPTSPKPNANLKNKKKDIAPSPIITPSNITLPPPPTRSRKIIQMKPEAQHVKRIEHASESSTSLTEKDGSSAAAAGKRKQTATTSTGRKIARKTAHSIIERRRRSKMNEEFGVLKDMIPACSGQEMHKLAILQASIEYLRYLEQCVSDLKQGRAQPAPYASPMTSDNHGSVVATPVGSPPSDDESDEEMEDDNADGVAESFSNHSPSVYNSTFSTITASPAFSSASQHSNYRFAALELPQPSYDQMYSRPQTQHSNQSFSAAHSTTPSGYSNQTSPLIMPELNSESDHEVLAALLLLNASDRRMAMLPPVSRLLSEEHDPRRPKGFSGGRGMSVQDLLRN